MSASSEPADMRARSHRDTICLEDAEVLGHQGYPGEQFLLRLYAPRCAERARAGQFVHLRCGPGLAMRRPMSIMRVDRERGWIQVLYKIVGEGTRELAERRVGERMSVLGPIGEPFTPLPDRPRALLLGGGVGIPPMIFLAEALRDDPGTASQPLVLLGSEVPFPFRSRPSEIMIPGMPAGVVATMPLLEDLDIPARLASGQGYSGCYPGYVPELARHWLDTLTPDGRSEVAVYGCGPEPMLEAVATLARDYDLPCQLSLEEYMACAVGGCAGCVVRVQSDEGPAMKRVCVDGPVFDAREVYVRS